MAVVFRDLDALLDDHQFLEWYVSQDNTCDMRLYKDQLMQSGYGIGLRKGHFLRHNIDQQILQYREAGLISQMYDKWTHSLCQDNIFANKITQTSPAHFGGLFIILCISVIGCFIALFPEFFFYKEILPRMKSSLHKLLVRKGLRRGRVRVDLSKGKSRKISSFESTTDDQVAVLSVSRMMSYGKDVRIDEDENVSMNNMQHTKL